MWQQEHYAPLLDWGVNNLAPAGDGISTKVVGTNDRIGTPPKLPGNKKLAFKSSEEAGYSSNSGWRWFIHANLTRFVGIEDRRNKSCDWRSHKRNVCHCRTNPWSILGCFSGICVAVVWGRWNAIVNINLNPSCRTYKWVEWRRGNLLKCRWSWPQNPNNQNWLNISIRPSRMKSTICSLSWICHTKTWTSKLWSNVEGRVGSNRLVEVGSSQTLPSQQDIP